MAQNFLDSSAVFHETALKYVLSPACLEFMRDKGWDTYTGLAFSMAFAPDDKAEGDYTPRRSSLEPSRALVNKFCQMHEEGILKYVAWEQLTSRSHEAQGLQRDVGTRLIVTDSSGNLRFRTVDNELSIPLGSDLKIEQNLLRFEAHNLLVARFTDDIVRHSA
eukprot:5537577-Amphidinium_carterae.2